MPPSGQRSRESARIVRIQFIAEIRVNSQPLTMFSASSVRRVVQCRVQAAARRTPPQHAAAPRRPCVHRAVRYISEESRSANRTGSLRPFSFWKGGRPDLGRILRISFFVHSVFYGRTVFLSLSFGFVVFTTLQFRDEDVPPCESGFRGLPLMYFFITFGSGFGVSATRRGPLFPLRLTLR